MRGGGHRSSTYFSGETLITQRFSVTTLQPTPVKHHRLKLMSCAGICMPPFRITLNWGPLPRYKYRGRDLVKGVSMF